MKEDVKNLLETSLSLFLKYGIKSVTMDDVAREAGISKKTIYTHFSDRSALIDAAVAYHLEFIQTKYVEHCQAIENPIDQLLETGKFFHTATRQINPTLLYDLKKLFPNTWKRITDHRVNFVQKQVSKNLQKGIESGFYRDDLNIEIISAMYIHMIELIIDDELFPKVKFTFKELQHELIHYHIHGIISQKGIEYLHAKKSENE